jgi:hypothetical protein
MRLYDPQVSYALTGSRIQIRGNSYETELKVVPEQLITVMKLYAVSAVWKKRTGSIITEA